MNYFIATEIAVGEAELPLGSLIKVTSDYGDWLIRIFQDGLTFHGESSSDVAGSTPVRTIEVAKGSTPVTDALQSLVSRLNGREQHLLIQTLHACNPAHRSALVQEILHMFKTQGPGAPILESIASLATWISSEHDRFACDALVPALMDLVTEVLRQSRAMPEAEQSIIEFMRIEMFTSVGLVRDRFLAAPVCRAHPQLLVNAASELMHFVDSAVVDALRTDTDPQFRRLLYTAIPKCVAARWLLSWTGHCPLTDVAAAANAQWKRTDETLARLRSSFSNHVLDITGGEWKRLALDVEQMRRELGADKAETFARRQVTRHLLYPLARVDDL